MSFYQCFDCQKVAPDMGGPPNICPLCGGVNGKSIDAKRVKDGMKSGALFNIDPKTGKPTKRQ